MLRNLGFVHSSERVLYRCALWCAVAGANPLYQALAWPKRQSRKIRLLQATLRAGLLHGVDVLGRRVEVHLEVPAGHSARRDTGSSKLSTMLAQARALIGVREVIAIVSVKTALHVVTLGDVADRWCGNCFDGEVHIERTGLAHGKGSNTMDLF